MLGLIIPSFKESGVLEGNLAVEALGVAMDTCLRWVHLQELDLILSALAWGHFGLGEVFVEVVVEGLVVHLAVIQTTTSSCLLEWVICSCDGYEW